MKKPLLFVISAFAAICIGGCSTKHEALFNIYEAPGGGLIQPSFVTIKHEQPVKVGEIYDVNGPNTLIGTCHTIGDTLVFSPCFTYGFSKDKFYLGDISNDTELNVLNIHRKYLIKKDSLIEITNYNKIIEDIAKMPYEPSKPFPLHKVK